MDDFDEHEYREQVISHGKNVTGFSMREGIESAAEDGLDPDEDWPSIEEEQVVLGVLWTAFALVIDGVRDESRAVVKSLNTGTPVDWDDLEHLYYLPERFRSQYDQAFLEWFLIAGVDLSARLYSQWQPPSNVAQELFLHLVVTRMSVLFESHEIRPYGDWESDLQDSLFEDLDYQLLLDPKFDGFENDPSFGPRGMVSMKFKDWFKTYPGYPISPIFSS